MSFAVAQVANDRGKAFDGTLGAGMGQEGLANGDFFSRGVKECGLPFPDAVTDRRGNGFKEDFSRPFWMTFCHHGAGVIGGLDSDESLACSV